ncbi:dihydropteroate synthase [Glycomyces fuscus]|nr:dihydropteroate synthase [Glycomyces fuscus]
MTGIMGVLNVTPDSFSDGAEFTRPEDAVARAERMADEGAVIIDVGGESTRPGARPVDASEELRRVLPVVEALADRFVVSIDTRKESVARACVRAGAAIINDVTASLGPVAADTGAGWIAMHMAGTPETMQHRPHYEDVVAEVRDHLLRRADAARAHGARRVWIDPGIGFGKDLGHNLLLLRNLHAFVDTGYPVLVGASRKSFIGRITGEKEPSERVAGSLTVAVVAALSGVDLVRVHDVLWTSESLRVARAIKGSVA